MNDKNKEALLEVSQIVGLLMQMSPKLSDHLHLLCSNNMQLFVGNSVTTGSSVIIGGFISWVQYVDFPLHQLLLVKNTDYSLLGQPLGLFIVSKVDQYQTITFRLEVDLLLNLLTVLQQKKTHSLFQKVCLICCLSCSSFPSDVHLKERKPELFERKDQCSSPDKQFGKSSQRKCFSQVTKDSHFKISASHRGTRC